MRHHHRESEEIYYLVEGAGEMEIDGEVARVAAGDAILIPPWAWHQIRADADGPRAPAVRVRAALAPPTTPTSDPPRPPREEAREPTA